MRDARSKGWVHAAATSTAPGHAAQISQDSGPGGGHQVVTIDGAHAEVVLVGGVAYIRGDASAVPNFFGLPASQAARLANQWISVQPTDSGYADTAGGVSLDSVLQESTVTGQLTEGAEAVVDGVRVVPITGTITDPSSNQTGTGTLSVTMGSHPLPLQLVEIQSDGTRITVTFGPWGVAVPLSAPTAAIPMSSVPQS
jgi:hypothetical protein